MGSLTEISVLYQEFTDALAEILAENVVGPARRGRLARARAIVKRHPHNSEGQNAGEDDTIGGRTGPPGTPIVDSTTTGTPNIATNPDLGA